MTLPWDLEDWLTDTGGRVVEKQAAFGDRSLSHQEQLILEIWILDTEVRNGGLSQYFANRGRERWEMCVALASAEMIPSFQRFATALTILLERNPDPYLALVASDVEANDLYHTYQPLIVRELKQAVAGGA